MPEFFKVTGILILPEQSDCKFIRARSAALPLRLLRSLQTRLVAVVTGLLVSWLLDWLLCWLLGWLLGLVARQDDLLVARVVARLFLGCC